MNFDSLKLEKDDSLGVFGSKYAYDIQGYVNITYSF